MGERPPAWPWRVEASAALTQDGGDQEGKGPCGPSFPNAPCRTRSAGPRSPRRSTTNGPTGL
eukprot:3173966-Pyramimonas_sp.AAC.1